MNSFRVHVMASCVALLVAGVGFVAVAAPQGEAVIATTEVTATVAKIDHETRAVTLTSGDGEEFSFVASDEVRNLAQVRVGDVVTVTYTEAVAYEVHPGGQVAATEAVAMARSALGDKPAGVVAHEVAMTVEIVAIDRETPTVTFRNAQGDTRTILVRHPEKLEGVNLGDTVDLIFTEALAIRVDPAE